ncbi:MAG: hypothetical protein Q8L92_08885, partial [Rubrivivax sp.]|nr:hypothetical protein [Rubrivivax sp.]
MKHGIAFSRAGVALALAVAAAGPAPAAVVLMGSDYLETVPSTFLSPLGPFSGLPIGPGNTDTIVRRLGDCTLDLNVNGSFCSVAIEIVALSLVSVGSPLTRIRESPTTSSLGSMTIFSDGSGTGGTFNSFFDIFAELSFDGGTTYNPIDFDPSTTVIDPKRLTSTGALWTTIEHGLLIDGLVGDGNANRHTNRNSNQVDFFILGNVIEESPDARHTAR